jgi:hypothetical protein
MAAGAAAASVVASRTKKRRELGDLFYLSTIPDDEEKICSYDLRMLMLDGQVACNSLYWACFLSF